MKKFAKAALVALLLTSGFAHADTVDNWRSGDSKLVWMNGTNEHCWRDNFWTPGTAASVKCGQPVAVAPVVAPIAPVVIAPIAVPEMVAKPQITTEKFTYSADALFDFDKASLKAEGQSKLNELAVALKDPAMKLEVVVAVGHTDSFGKDAYNDKLSLARANAVKAYLVSQGLNAGTVFAEGKGKRQLKVMAASCPKKRADRIVCEAPNRRVEVEVTGTKTVTTMIQQQAMPMSAPNMQAPQ